MLIRNSIKQLMRTPVKTVLFFLLIIFGAILSTLGSNLWRMSSANMKAFEEVFTTIGTVEQKKTVLSKVEVYDSLDESNRYFYTAEYNDPIPVSVLDFEGADYIYQPEKRPFYGAYLPGYELLPPNAYWGFGEIIIEFSVDEDCIPDHPVKIKVEKEVYCRYHLNMPTLWFCDRYNPAPDMLYKGKTYIMAIVESYDRNDIGVSMIYVPTNIHGSYQYTKEGKLLPDDTRNILYEEVTEGFYETEHGKRWLNLAESIGRYYETVPVTTTNSTKLLIPFYNGTTYIELGEDISNEEYANGEKVCLVSSSFAKYNKLKVGDKLTLPLYYANYRHSAGRAFGSAEVWGGFNMLNAKGEGYPIFYEAEYTIVGIYLSLGGGGGYNMAEHEIIIPTKSIEASDEENIIAYGPMMGYTTSFQIPNGSIEEYMEKFQKLGIDDLELKFYDKGYTELRAGLEHIKGMSIFLLTAGLVATVLILVFFCNMLITKQKKRTAIERSLGMSKWSCTRSMIYGILLMALIGSIIGSTTGFLLTDRASSVISGSEHYDSTYTNGSVSNASGDETNEELEYAKPDMALSMATGGFIVVLAVILSLVVVTNNLKYEPLELLSEKGE